MKIIKIILIWLLSFLSVFSVLWAAPSYNGTVDEGAAWWYEATLKADHEASLEENIRKLFFPKSEGGDNAIWNELRIALVWLFIVMILWGWVLMLLNANKEEELSKYRSNLLYLIYGWLLIFGVVWIVGDVLQVWYNDATIENVVIWTQWVILAKLLVFLKVLAYFVAIVMVVYYGFQIIKANDKEEAITKWKTWLLNVMIAIFSLKILDYLYYIAQQKSFPTEADALLATIAKGLWWIAGIMLVLALIYAAFILFTSRWQEDAWTKAKNIVRNVFIAGVIIFMFIVIMHNMIWVFGPKVYTPN